MNWMTEALMSTVFDVLQAALYVGCTYLMPQCKKQTHFKNYSAYICTEP